MHESQICYNYKQHKYSDEDFSQTELDQSVDILHEFIFEEDEFSSCRI